MPKFKAMVLGGSGFIGKACARALVRAGFEVTGVSRTQPAGGGEGWVQADISQLSVQGWTGLLEGVDVVVNAAGALQDGMSDSLNGVHVYAIETMVQALKGRSIRVVQISAAGVHEDADTDFFRSKAVGDAALMQGHDDWVVLRPGLVIGAEAYGGTALLRAHAGFPGIEWRMFEDVPVQTVAVEDVAKAVVACASGDIASGLVLDLAEQNPHDFSALSQKFRVWQGFSGRRLPVRVPPVALELIGRLADVAGWLGWRSPLRRTALGVMQNGIVADGSAWQRVSGSAPGPLDETLAMMPAYTQERWFARMYLLLPLTILTLSLFWLVSGVMGLLQSDAAMEVLVVRGQTEALARTLVLGGSFVDLGLGGAVLWRRWARPAALGMVLVSLSYLVSSLLFAPDLWLDPLGPMVKIVPSMLAALIPLLFLEKR